MLTNDDLAPIVLFTYNRLELTKKTVNHLQNNILAKYSNLIIFSDASKADGDEQQIKDIRRYLRSVKGFKSCRIIERENNFGLARNIIEGVTEIIQEFGKIIVLEDDLITSKNFLCFMNESLEYYKERRDIFSISGYTANLPSLNKLQIDDYLSYRPSSWGWATWKHQWADIDWDVSDFKKFIKSRSETRKFNRGGIDMVRMLKHYMEGKNNSWAIRWSYAMYKDSKYCIYPKISKVQNIGFGDDATHCTGENIYLTSLDISCNSKFNHTNDISVNPQIAKEFSYQYSYINKGIKKVKHFIRRKLNET
jgi:hypothetical protein